MYKIGWFSTGRGQGSLNLLNAMVKAIEDKTVRAEIAYVFCSREEGDAEGSDRYIKQVKNYGLKLITFSSKKFKPSLRKEGKTNSESMIRWRREYDMEIMRRLEGLEADINVLAGYMLILSADMCERFDMINLHPAAPGGPSGTWQEVIWQLIKERAADSGNMMHLVTGELDKGAPITYCMFPLRGAEFDSLWDTMEHELCSRTLEEIIKTEGQKNPLFQKIRHEGARREIPLVIETIRAFASGRLQLVEKKILNEGKTLNEPFCLTADIEKLLEQ